MSLQRIRNSKGFTIIELLIVIVVIGILAALVLTAYGNIQQRARNAERQNDVNEIHKAAELYYTDDTQGGGTGFYPKSLATDLKLGTEVTTDPNDVAYNYTAMPASCTAAAKDCTYYTLSIALEGTGAGTFTRNSLNGQP